MFNSAAELSNWEPVINYYGFTLAEGPDDFLSAKLWSQLELLRPDSYLGLGDRWLMFVTRSESLYEQALAQKDLEATTS